VSVAEFVSTDKDVRRTEEFAYEATQSERRPRIKHNGNTDFRSELPAEHADEMLDVVICVNLRDLRASPFDFGLRNSDFQKCAHRAQTFAVFSAKGRRPKSVAQPQCSTIIASE